MNSIYQDISKRTNGEIYLGVVGPVRTGKSTFVTKFMQELILPNIADKHDRNRAVDELPQSADGKIIPLFSFAPRVSKEKRLKTIG